MSRADGPVTGLTHPNFSFLAVLVHLTEHHLTEIQYNWRPQKSFDRKGNFNEESFDRKSVLYVFCFTGYEIKLALGQSSYQWQVKQTPTWKIARTRRVSIWWRTNNWFFEPRIIWRWPRRWRSSRRKTWFDGLQKLTKQCCIIQYRHERGKGSNSTVASSVYRERPKWRITTTNPDKAVIARMQDWKNNW
jgi:hypothetical protein